MRRLMLNSETEDEEVKEWKINGEEYELMEDKKIWEFVMPDVTEILAIYLPFGTTANASGGAGGITVTDGTNRIDFTNIIPDITLNTANKVWARCLLRVVLDNGMIYAEMMKDVSYWDFTTLKGKELQSFFPTNTLAKKITSFALNGYERYIGAGAKIKVWAR